VRRNAHLIDKGVGASLALALLKTLLQKMR
jgi:hypothetical protein